MRLKCIRLAGFKSFVDPTTVYFPTNMGAVVGPNGCGKSNIIDAVRWVMGESSAKNLRGESMTDVIFNMGSILLPIALGTAVGYSATKTRQTYDRIKTNGGGALASATASAACCRTPAGPS